MKIVEDDNEKIVKNENTEENKDENKKKNNNEVNVVITSEKDFILKGINNKINILFEVVSKKKFRKKY
jgi:hypothetical protein